MNSNRRIVFGIGIVLAVLVLLIAPASAHVTLQLVPEDIRVIEGEGHSAYVEIWANVTDVEEPDDDALKMGQFAIHYDPSCINITEHPVWGDSDGWGSFIDCTMASWNAYPNCGGGPGYDMIMFTFAFPVPHQFGPSPQMIANFTVESICDNCLSDLTISCGEEGCYYCAIQVLPPIGPDLYPNSTTLINATVTCGTPSPPEAFTTSLAPGWNLISLPLTPLDDSTSAVLGNDDCTIGYGEVYSYDASTNQFVDVTTGTMETGVGYFVDVTTAGTWSYDGFAYESLNSELSQGLNCIGWTNTNADLPGAFDSIAGDYRYVSRWNTAEQKYELYDPVGETEGPEFIDFTTMERGVGYFIAATNGCTLTYP